MADVSSTSPFRPPVADFQLPRIEEDILALWARRGTERKSLAPKGQKAFVFYDGPPFATGLPHYGHLLAGTLKDIVPRYWAMQGYDVERRFGWDTHGLPIESLIESELGIHGRAEIEAYGVPKFNAACRAGVLRFTKEWQATVRRMGRWVDFENEYKTMDPSFMESVWWVFRQLWDKGLIYEGFRIQPVSPALGTPLSNFEVAQGPQERDPVTKKDGHKRRQDPSLTVRFKLEDEDAYLWAWTTTPWTLPSNLALAVHPDVTYAKVRVLATGELAYVEPSRLRDYQERKRIGDTEELARVKGSELVGRAYVPLLPYFVQYKTREDGSRWCFRVVAADYVTTDSGTGIVHIAPAFGEDDFQVGQREGLPVVNPLNLSGVFVDERVGDLRGQFAKDADKHIAHTLKEGHKLVDQDVLVHAYPHCYRTDQPLLYMALSTWFMKVEEIREALVNNNQQIHWVPDHVGSGRFGNWLENARDWNLSRNRFWGTPIPVWRNDEDPSELLCVGSVEELEKLAGRARGSLPDLHRESIDTITFPAPSGRGTMRRISEVFDCWFESGSMPYAQNHYPFAKDKVEYVEHNLPADFIAEGLDQTRGWFYTLHVLSTALFGRPAFKNVIVNGLILAADGKKMSKRLKNYPDPNNVIESYGADALRAYLINSAVVRAEPMRFGKDANDTTGECVKETVRLVVLPLWNAYNFLATYAIADGWKPSAADLSVTPSGELDRWILSRVQHFLAEMKTEYEGYELSNLVPAFVRLSDELNNWYIRRGRRRYWSKAGESREGDLDKREAYATLFRVLVTVVRAMAPVLPFFTEYLYQRLLVDTGLAAADASVHFERFPEAEQRLLDLGLEARMQAARDVVGLGLVVREREKIGVRRPLGKLTVASPDPRVREAVAQFEDAILGELNVKSVEVIADDSSLCKVTAKPNFRTLGKRLGPKLKAVQAALAAFGPAQIAALTQDGRVELEGETLTVEDVLLTREASASGAVESQNGLTVLLDTAITPALHHEGLARELVNRVQNLRKAANLDVSQRIRLRIHAEGAVATMLDDGGLRELVARETLALTIERVTRDAAEAAAHVKPESIEKDKLVIGLEVG